MEDLFTAAWIPGFAVRSLIAATLAWAGFYCARGFSDPWRSRLMGVCVTAVIALPLVPFPSQELATVAPTAMFEAASALKLAPWLALIWIIGVVWLGVHWCSGVWLIRRVSARAENAQLTKAVQSQLGDWKDIRILVSDSVSVPFACGVWRKHVILPESSSCWDESRLVQVLTHEIHHHRAGDVLLQTLSDAICRLLWWNPLVWRLMREWQREREYAADRAVLKIASPACYAENLLDLSANLKTSDRALAAALYITRRGVLETLIRKLLTKPENPSDARRWLAAVVLSAV
ncbi:MAG: M56 family metallopeptidase, partial [Verrucomicrobiota bacterium]